MDAVAEKTYLAIKDAKEMADFIADIEGVKYPAFHSMSDARACAVLLRETTSKTFYAHEGEGLQGVFYYVA